MKKICLWLGVWWIAAGSLQGQILQDTQTQVWISEGLNHMYNYEFKEAASDFVKLREKYPQSPAWAMLTAISMEIQYFPLKEFPAQQKQYLALLQTANKQAMQLLESSPDDQEGVFFALISYGYMAAYNADNVGMIDAIGPAKKAYSYMKKSMKLVEKNPEFLYACGMYNFYREVYPDVHPIIKPFMWFFMSGDRKKGLQQMEMATRKSIFTKVEAMYYYAYVHIKYENQFKKSMTYNEVLYEKFPNNLLIQMQRLELLSHLGRYEEARPLAQSLMKQRNPMYAMAGLTFGGMLGEKHDKDERRAQELYEKAVKLPYEERFSKEYWAMAYLGLGRIHQRAGQVAKAKECFKKAAKTAEYEINKAETKRWLKEE
jgi:tetratricopeptide (TPR) repeat protein